MAQRDTSRFVITDATQIIPGDRDLGDDTARFPDGTVMTEENTDTYTAERAAASRGGRPSLDEGTSPAISLRVPRELRAAAEEIAEKEGRALSAVARSALEEYVAAHRAS